MTILATKFWKVWPLAGDQTTRLFATYVGMGEKAENVRILLGVQNLLWSVIWYVNVFQVEPSRKN